MTDPNSLSMRFRSDSLPDRELLESWKEIAVFFKRDVRTVQLWEKHERMPVHRHQHRKVATVHAYRSELKRWWERRCHDQTDKQAANPPAETKPTPSHSSLTTVPANSSMVSAMECIPAFSDPRSQQRLLALREAIEKRISMLTRWRIASATDSAARNAGQTNWHPDKPEHKPVRSVDSHGADYLLSGMILESAHGDASFTAQVHLQLTSLRLHSVIWSRQFAAALGSDGSYESLAERIALSIARHALMQPAPVSAIGDINPAARYAYLRGRYFWSLRSQPEAIRRAMEQFKLATELNPLHARSFAGLADCYIVMFWLAMLPRSFAVASARHAATQALMLDESLSEAHVSLGSILFDFDWDWHGAEREFLQGIQLNPTNAQAYQWYGESLSILGADENAIHAAQRAQEMDPASPIVASFLGNALYRAGKNREAITQYRHALDIDADCLVAHTGLGLANMQEERFEEALHSFNMASTLSSDYPDVRAMMAHAYASKGEQARARSMIAALTAELPRQNMPVLDIAATHIALRDRDAAFDCLYAGMRERNIHLAKLQRDPRLRPLHADARFHHLVDVLHMP